MRECYKCDGFLLYYVKGYMGFEKRKFGYCKRLNTNTMINETCYHWNSNTDYKETRKRITLETLNEMANDISEIKQILKEEAEEQKVKLIKK